MSDVVLKPWEQPIVGLGLEGPGRQSRWSVGFRGVLVLPHVLYAYVLILIGMFAVMAGWFAALFTGRMPESIAKFVAGIEQYCVRVFGYGYLLLTDEYPPFRLHDDHAIAVIYPPRGKLSRAAVLFRFILQIPAFLLYSLITSGLAPFVFVFWIITLVSGRLPRIAFEAEAAVLRYLARFYAYSMMLTPTYPNELFGDPPTLDREPLEIDESEEGGGELPSPFDAPTGMPRRPRISRFVLSKGARRLVIAFIVVGALSSVGSSALNFGNATRAARAAARVSSRHDELYAASSRFQADTQACALRDNGIDCLHQADKDLADAFDTFSIGLNDISFPIGASGAALDLDDTTERIITELHLMATAGGAEAYQLHARRYLEAATEFDRQYRDLLLSLGVAP